MRHVVTNRGILLPAENGNLIVDTNIVKYPKETSIFSQMLIKFPLGSKTDMVGYTYTSLFFVLFISISDETVPDGKKRNV